MMKAQPLWYVVSRITPPAGFSTEMIEAASQAVEAEARAAGAGISGSAGKVAMLRAGVSLRDKHLAVA